MTASEQMKLLFQKRECLSREQRQVDATLNDLRRTWAKENSLMMLPHMDTIKRQVMT